jgi:predicted nucleotide-binding protein
MVNFFKEYWQARRILLRYILMADGGTCNEQTKLSGHESELLERAIARLKTLPASQQDALAKLSVRVASRREGIAVMILEELEDEIRWDEAFAGSKDTLAKLAAEAMAEYHAGKTQELDPETL